MTLQELFAKHGVESAELQAEVQGLLTTAESKKTDGIPMSRFSEKVQECNTLRADKVELESKITTLESSRTETTEEITRLKGIETKFNEYQTKSDSEVVENWKTKAKVFDLKDTNPNHERITKLKESFAFDEELTIEQTRKNLETYAIMETAGAFKDVKVEVIDGDRFENQRQQSAEDDPLSAFDN